MPREQMTLTDAARVFRRRPSPWMIGALLLAAAVTRATLGDWRLSDLLVPALMIAVFPLFEWVVHVTVLHWRPRRIGGLTLDSLLARKHREHHGDPRDVPLIFIPWQTLCWLLPAATAIGLFAFPRLETGLTFLTCLGLLGLGYEWTHYLVHSDYKPRTRLYRAIWRNHRLHHFKNEHYWFTVTSSGTADRVLGTYPDPAGVPSSPTVKALHARYMK
ncbi:sterol desaturase family protein [Amycolatopsis sp. 195334CR]|uniref:sterol desaturase family protein n=1 Tax=Amycolatopsis sp. 195334CR TaxID=2814588 RepID=UPI001A8D307D|nr:sterol desaturase family protein [Amycolatopsis sp. 195334CR]MBN6039482.1 sterol desaturase family protein [Amycolatopsis sp. 195334CR]